MPYLLSIPDSPKSPKSYLIITSCLALVPFARCPIYNATKAALHMFVLGLRLQMKDTNLEILECFPPTVEVRAASLFRLLKTSILGVFR
jgi:short-subunit dehydrogenase involved in D-alanine esterification of teichoic acids